MSKKRERKPVAPGETLSPEEQASLAFLQAELSKSPARKPKAKRTPQLRSAPKPTTLAKLCVGEMVEVGEHCYRVGTAHPYGIDMHRILAEPGGFREVGMVTMGERTKATQVFAD